MSSLKKLEIQFEDHPNPNKWSHPLKEDGFTPLINQTVFGSGSFFSPLLFGKFFDPSDAFPLWEFESDTLLSNLSGSGQQHRVDWFQTDAEYVLKAQLPVGISSIQVCVESGNILEISGKYRELCRTDDWKIGRWWEQGFVRRLELPEQSDWRKSEAHLKNEVVLEIRVPKGM